MSSQEPELRPPTYHGAPFDDPDADMLVRSSDAVQYRTFKLIMGKTSPDFRSLLAMNAALWRRPGGLTLENGISLQYSDGDKLPVLCLPVTSEVLTIFLSIAMSSVFPSPPSIPDALEQVIPVLAVAETYQARYVSLYIRSQRRRETQNPILAFSLAWSNRLPEETLSALRAIACLDAFTIESVGEDLRFLSGPSLHELVRCHTAMAGVMNTCMRELRTSTNVASWIQRNYRRATPACGVGNGGLPKWLNAFLNLKANVTGEMALYYNFSQHTQSRLCKDCCAVPQSAVRALWGILEDELLQSLMKTLGLAKFEDDPGLVVPPLPENYIGPSTIRADVVLRSCDLEDFRVHKDTLATASPLFNDMFNSPQLGSTTDAALPVIDMQESAETLAHLVTVIYPTIFFPPTTVDSLMALLAALQKYGMGLEVDGTLAKYRAQFRLSYLPRFLVEQACRAYMLAVHYRLKEEAQLAARALLASPVTFESCGDDMRLLPTGAALHDLVQYRVGCRDAAKAALLDGLASHDDSAWFRSPERRIPIQEPSPFGGGSMSRTVMAQECTTQRRPVRGCAQSPALPGWLATHLEYIHAKLGAAGGLALSADVEAAVFESCSSALQAHLDGGGADYCVSCAAAHAEDRDVLWTTLAKTIGKAIAEVAFECFW